MRTHAGLLLTFAAVLTFTAVGTARAETAAPTALGQTVEPGPTGWAAKRPVMAVACPHACPFGEIGAFVQSAMKPHGYDILLCHNCNGLEGPRLVARKARSPALTPLDLELGTEERLDAPVDFGVTLTAVLDAAYRGAEPYTKDGPYRNLRLIAKIEDPTYLLVAVRRDSGLTDLAQIRERHMPVRILASGPLSKQVLAYYGLTPEAVAAQGGSIGPAMGGSRDAGFDVIVSDLASPANNWESSDWTAFSQSRELLFLQLPSALLDELARQSGVERVTARWGLLRGIDHPIATVGRSGEAIFARDDLPDQAAYDLARAIDSHRAELKWYVRPYSYDPQTVWSNLSVPLHPGALRWYREQGYLASRNKADR